MNDKNLSRKTKVFSNILLFFLCLIFAFFYVSFARAEEEPMEKEIVYTAAYAREILRACVNLEERKTEYDLDLDERITAADVRIALRRSVSLPDEPTVDELEEEIETILSSELVELKEYFQIGVLSTCDLTEEQLVNGLCGNLKQYAWAFLEAEREYNVNATFLAAVAAFESGWGSSYLAIHKNNFFGWRGGSGFMYFNTPVEGIMHVARSLREKYLTPGGGCFRGYNVEDIAICYCPGGGWSNQVYGIMNMIKRNAK